MPVDTASPGKRLQVNFQSTLSKTDRKPSPCTDKSRWLDIKALNSSILWCELNLSGKPKFIWELKYKLMFDLVSSLKRPHLFLSWQRISGTLAKFYIAMNLLAVAWRWSTVQDVQAFLRHCYRSLDVRAVRNADLMRLIMLADEFDSKSLVEECDQLLVERSDRKPFTYFIELSNGGDMVDWLRLTDSVGLKKAGSICEMHLARHLKENPGGQESARMHELGQDCLLRVINKLAQIWHLLHPTYVWKILHARHGKLSSYLDLFFRCKSSR